MEAGDSLVLCSDGVSDVVDDMQILETVRRYPASQPATALVNRALKAGAIDNATAVVIDLPGVKKGGGVATWI